MADILNRKIGGLEGDKNSAAATKNSVGRAALGEWPHVCMLIGMRKYFFPFYLRFFPWRQNVIYIYIFFVFLKTKRNNMKILGPIDPDLLQILATLYHNVDEFFILTFQE